MESLKIKDGELTKVFQVKPKNKLDKEKNYKEYYYYNYTLKQQQERAKEKLSKRQKEFEQLCGHWEIKDLRKILSLDEYMVIVGYYGLNGVIASTQVLAAQLADEDGKSKSRQWIIQLKSQGISKILRENLKKANIQESTLAGFLTDNEWIVFNTFYGIDTGRHFDVKTIASRMKIEVERVEKLLKKARSKISEQK